MIGEHDRSGVSESLGNQLGHQPGTSLRVPCCDLGVDTVCSLRNDVTWEALECGVVELEGNRGRCGCKHSPVPLIIANVSAMQRIQALLILGNVVLGSI